MTRAFLVWESERSHISVHKGELQMDDEVTCSTAEMSPLEFYDGYEILVRRSNYESTLRRHTCVEMDLTNSDVK